MNEKIKKREIDKFYLALVHGTPSPSSATLEGYLIKNEKTNTVRVFDEARQGAKQIITKYKIIKEYGDHSLVEIELLTGRTHQIRAHMAHIGHPLVGDGKYGKNQSDRELGFRYQALCSYRLRFSFAEDSECELDYLRGKEFSIPKEKIYFANGINQK